MMLILHFLCAAAAAAAAAAATTIVHTPHSKHLTQGARADPARTIPVLFAIAQQRLDQLEQLLLEVSNPKHPNYGHHLSQNEVTALTSRPKSTQVVINWLHDHGYHHVVPTRTGDYVHAEGSVGLVEKSLGAQFHSYHININITTTMPNSAIVLTEEYVLPSKLSAHVDFVGKISNFVGPLSTFVATSSPRLQTSPGELPGNTTLALVNKVYNVSSNVVRPDGGATQGVLAIGQALNLTDLITFSKSQQLLPPYSNVTVSGPGRNFPFECLHSPNTCLEASLDMETIAGLARGSRTNFWMADPNSQTWFGDYMLNLVNLPDGEAPLINSISYDIEERTHSSLEKDRFNTNVMKLGVRGITILAASGDDGVSGYMTRNSGKQACGFHPGFPATNPYVLSVGATNGPEANLPERACTFNNGGLISSGGGFSDYFSRPAWQEEAVSSYLKRAATGGTLPPTTMFNATGRAYPDVALLGHSYPTSVAGTFYPVSGTSASTPAMAALLTLVNEARLKAGQAPVGFVTPALYSLASSSPAVFHDIIGGENNCCAAETNPVCCDHAFTAIAGYDPVTGLGSINHGLLVEALLALGEGTNQ